MADLHIEVYVEEPSAKAALENLLPRLIGVRATWKILNFRGKSEMLRSLPNRFLAIRQRIKNEQLRVLVLIDRDQEDCRVLKNQLEVLANNAGLKTKSSVSKNAQFSVINRIIVEELEAWFFGDCDALRSAYSRIPKNIERKARYRDPDNLQGGTWEALHREMKRVGYFEESFPKIVVARRVSEFMEPERNRSRSFQIFRDAIEAMLI